MKTFDLVLGRLIFTLALCLIFVQASAEKFHGGAVPEWFTTQFADTFVPRLPGGTTFAFWGVATLEALAALLLGAGLIASLFRKRQATAMTGYGFLAAETVFFMLGFGLRLSHRYPDAAALFAYLGITLLVHASLVHRNSVA